ncbi:ketoacyl-ACP synthase III [Xenorhabdus sp. DI]|uniref:beta-ketoacyl-ACP synthase III n=1 Tax=Xenorhabdus doucetiae TaxID=351671 RepID=UPI0019C34B41|nr:MULTISPECIES: beta-ketoacyl-ACP synthase III [unclassified Xenorhabdus]MBD2784464.1 ketoacyl-ACP synthase III [Xenorhabdus sp. 3]MBD2789276.1 ketoacyl-ACP synthase III [Xenorhabdus sp. DI]
MAVKIVGLGASLPRHKVSNKKISDNLDTSDEWITTRTGIKNRFHSSDGEHTSTLAYKAGKAALSSMNRKDDFDIDTLILATSTPDRLCPATAPKVATMLGVGRIRAFDINAVCTGFVYGLELAETFLRSGKSKRLMLIGADVFTTILDKNDRATYPLFGDGAGAIILEQGDEENLLATYTGSDGEYENLITILNGGSESKLSKNRSFGMEHSYFKMEGKEVFLKAISHMESSVQKVLKLSGTTASEIDYIVPHQANKRIIDTLTQLLGMKKDQALMSLEEFGNTSTASIPLTLAMHAECQTVRPGHKIVITAFGGGITWGAAVLKWPSTKISPIILNSLTEGI